MNKERVCAYIDLNNLRHNIEEIHKCNPNADIMCVIKADAYGHGSVEFAKILENIKAKYVFPMHCWGQYEVIREFRENHDYAMNARLINITGPGQEFVIE